MIRIAASIAPSSTKPGGTPSKSGITIIKKAVPVRTRVACLSIAISPRCGICYKHASSRRLSTPVDLSEETMDRSM
jgi:hypothetical protein